MVKTRTRFFCQECGTVALKWQGKCPGCGQWNTFAEETTVSGAAKSEDYREPELLESVDTASAPRFLTLNEEFDRVSGGGLVPGSMVLIGGPPGIGKSTLLLQIARGVARTRGNVLYVSGEESAQQVKMRYTRLGISSDKIFILTEINIDLIVAAIERTRPVMVMIDSIQTLYKPDFTGAPGSVTQVRECTAALLRTGKSLGITVLIVGHVTKDGTLAGPRVLEHLVDTVLYFEGEGAENYRVLKSVKNRFGSTHEVGIFEMDSRGLTGIENASAFFLARRGEQASGSVVIPVMEGSRPILVELQALVTRSYFGFPARKAKGIDLNRLAVLVAVLEKRASLLLSQSDIFVNVVGGMELDEPAIDLGVIAAIASSFYDTPLHRDCIIFGEVGLGGEIRGVSHGTKRILEAERLGFSRCVAPESTGTDELSSLKNLALHKVHHINEALDRALVNGWKARG